MFRIWISCILVSLSVSGFFLAAPLLGEELLVNGDFEIGTPENDKPEAFVCNAWRRLLWRVRRATWQANSAKRERWPRCWFLSAGSTPHAMRRFYVRRVRRPGRM